MRRWLLVLAACGGGGGGPVTDLPPPRDAVVSFGNDACACAGCQVLTQTGCNTGEKCSWVLATDNGSDGMPGLGADACAPSGGQAVGAACMVGTVAQGGYDDCVGGAICIDGTCEQICDLNGGTPTCGSGRACIAHEGIFANVGATTTPAGVCDVACDPLDDNDFDGSGTTFTKPGTACGSDPVVGCYGHPSGSFSSPFGCSHPNPATAQLTHRAAAPPNLRIFNACMSGYELSTIPDEIGGMAAECLAWCKPGDAYNGNVNPNQPNGVAPHRCNTTDALGAFGTPATNTVNGEHCMYSWQFELDDQNHLHRSATSDTLGVCVDHTRYKYDVDGDGTPDTVWPACATLPLADAAKFGCVSTALAMPSFAKPRRYIQRPELR